MSKKISYIVVGFFFLALCAYAVWAFIDAIVRGDYIQAGIQLICFWVGVGFAAANKGDK